MIIAIDGPSGSGKSTIAQEVAKRLGYQLIDTGAMYRTLTYVASEEGLDLNSDDGLVEERLVTLARGLSWSFSWEGGKNQLRCNGREIGEEIRSEEVGLWTSRVAERMKVREVMLGAQRELGRSCSSVMEGRDIGTVVFPDAEVKVFLSASVEVRAQRRFEQALARGDEVAYEGVLAGLRERDARDSNRAANPLRCAEDAVRVDSTVETIEGVVERILGLVKEVSVSEG